MVSANVRCLTKGLLYSGLLLALYWTTLTWLTLVDWAREDFTYSYLIPIIIVYLLWERRETIAAAEAMPSWKGLIPFLIGLTLFWLGELSGEFLSLYISLWLVVLGLCWLHLGWNKLKLLSFPFFIALTMFPLPIFLYGKVSFQLKLISSQLGVEMMRLYGMSAYREGNVIDLGFTQLQVVDACSGLRYIIPLIVLGILLAYFFKASFWKRTVVVLSTVPLSIITNSLRIAITGILYEVWGAEVAEGFFHGFSGWFIFMFSLAVLLGEMYILGFRFHALGRRDGSGAREGESKVAKQSMSSQELTRRPVSSLPHRKPSATRAFFSPPQFLVAATFLLITFGLSYGVEFREKIPMTRSFSQFPLEIGEWSGTRLSMEKMFIDTLDLSDYVMIDFKDREGRHVDFYVAYYESQRKGESIHSPETCLPGGGWTFDAAGTGRIPMPSNPKSVMPVNRAVMQKGAYRQLAYYWFPMRGRILTNAYQLKIYTFWDALTRQRTDGALVRVITPLYENEPLASAEKRLQGFVTEIVPVLDQFIPR